MTEAAAFLKRMQANKDLVIFVNGLCRSSARLALQSKAEGHLQVPAKTHATLVMVYDTEDQDQILTVGAEAKLNIVLLYLNQVNHSLKIDQANGSELNIFQIALDSDFLKNTLIVNLNAEYAVCNIKGIQFARQQHAISTSLSVYHRAPHTLSEVNYKSIADQKGEVYLSARVHVASGAVKTTSEMNLHNLLLSNLASIDTLPELEIYADDVKCSHGATVGDLNEESLFYLRSRCIDQQQARSILIQAFMQDLIDGLQPGVQPYVTERIAHQLNSLEVTA